jgi:very-short-patch-repair endonuclease
MPRHASRPVGPGLGPFRGSTAIADGLTTRSRLAGKAWRRLLPDVYIAAGTPLDHPTWCEAALLAAPAGTVLCHRSALGRYCPLLMPGGSEPVDLAVPRSTSLHPQPRLRQHRMRLAEGDTILWAGMPMTTPARTSFDLASGRDLIEAVVCVDALLNRRLTTIGEISRYLLRTPPGSARAARALRLSSPDAESPMETRTRLLLVLAGLPTPQVQVKVYDCGVVVARLDLAYPEHRLGVEYDGDQHRDLATFRADAVRANQLRLCGWTVLRFTADGGFAGAGQFWLATDPAHFQFVVPAPKS